MRQIFSSRWNGILWRLAMDPVPDPPGRHVRRRAQHSPSHFAHGSGDALSVRLHRRRGLRGERRAGGGAQEPGSPGRGRARHGHGDRGRHHAGRPPEPPRVLDRGARVHLRDRRLGPAHRRIHAPPPPSGACAGDRGRAGAGAVHHQRGPDRARRGNAGGGRRHHGDADRCRGRHDPRRAHGGDSPDPPPRPDLCNRRDRGGDRLPASRRRRGQYGGRSRRDGRGRRAAAGRDHLEDHASGVQPGGRRKEPRE
jgi:hypothetical protein